MFNQKLILPCSLCVLVLSSCATVKDFDATPAIKGLEKAKIEAMGNARFQKTQTVPNWWKTLQDEQLNQLIEHALEHNKDVKVAIANLFEARGIAREAGLERYPTVTANGGATRNRTSGELGAGNSQTSNNVNVGFDASWELDLFGRVSQGIKASDARAQAAQANLRDVYVTIASEVARTYIELRGAQYRLNIAQRNSINQNKTFELTQTLSSGGRGTQLDVLRAKTQLDLTQSTIPTFTAEITANINRLSVLTGELPDSLTSTFNRVMPLPSIPNSVNMGNIADLLKRRPDIAVAENNLKAAIADYNVSIADQFPKVNLMGTFGFAATSISSFGASAVVASVGPNVSWSAFDIGRVKARINQNDARAQAAIARYEKTVLEALEELQTSVSNFSMEEQRRGSLQSATRSAKEAANLALSLYQAGIYTFIDALSAEAILFEAEDTLAQSEITTALDIIAVYKALGGGWEFKG